MRGKSKKAPKPLIPSPSKSPSAVKIEDGGEPYLADHKVSISLKYYKKSCECFSDWGKEELRKFSATIEKISGYSPEGLKGNPSLCKYHKGSPSACRFTRPDIISEDLQFFEIKIDRKARVHGFFERSVFFLVWLDREHACFPE